MPGETWPVATPVPVVRERVRARTLELDRRRRRLHLSAVTVSVAVVGALVLSVGSSDGPGTRVGITPAADVGAWPDDVTAPGAAPSGPGQPAPDAGPGGGGGDSSRPEAVPSLPTLGTTTTTAAPVPAPSGGDIAFTRDEAVWLMKSDGSNAGPVTDDTHRLFDLDWRPDGKLLAATERQRVNPGGTSKNRVVLVSLDGRVDPLTPYDDWAHSPKWSPDGRRIAFQRFTGKGERWNDLWIMDADGSNSRSVVPDFGYYHSWSPDGRGLAYQCGSSGPVCILDVQSGVVRQVPNTAGTTMPGWAPDGRIGFLVSDGSHTIRTIETDGTDARSVVTTPGRYSPTGITWSPRARSLAFSLIAEPSSCLPYNCPSQHQVWRVDVDGSNLVRLTQGPNDWYPDWSPAASPRSES